MRVQVCGSVEIHDGRTEGWRDDLQQEGDAQEENRLILQSTCRMMKK